MTKVRPILTIIVAIFVLLSGCSSIADMGGQNTPTPSPTPIEQTDTSTQQTTTELETTTKSQSNSTNQTQTQTVTETVTETKTPTETAPSEPRKPFNVTIVASGGGESHYRMYVDQVGIDLGGEADGPDESDNPDSVYLNDPYYAYGFVGDGGVDNFYVDNGYNASSPDLTFVNDGNATLKVYVNGELYDSILPGRNLDEYGSIGGSTSTPEGTTTTQSESHTLTIKAAGGGTSNYEIHGLENPQTASDTEKTDEVGDGSVKGITGENAKDMYRMEGNSVGEIVNEGTATLEVYVDGSLVKTVPSEKSSTKTATETETVTETTAAEDTSTPTPTETETPTPAETETSTPTPTPEPTLDTENMKKVEVKSLEEERVDYAFSASGTVYLGEETGSSAQVEGQKGSGTVENYETDTFYIPKDKKVIEARNLGQHPIEVTVDGESIDVSDGPDVDKSAYKSNSTIRIEAVGSNQTDYEFSVTGDAFPTGESDSSNAVYPDEIREEFIVGTVGDGGTDKYKYTGKMVGFFNFGDGPLKVFIDGKLIATVEDGGSLRIDNN